MSANKNMRKIPEKEEDITIPTMEEEIDAWCKLPPQSSKSKSIADIEIDAWCAGSSDPATKQEKKKKN